MHFPVLVVGKSKYDVDKALAPYQEEVTIDSPYAKVDIICKNDKESVLKYIEEHAEDLPELAMMKSDVEEGHLVYALEYIDNYEGMGENENGDIIEYYNPNAKWDYYIIGESGKVGDIDWDKIRQEVEENLHKTYKDTKKRFKDNWPFILSPPHKNYDKTLTEEQYVSDNMHEPTTHAIVTKDGWFEKGEMG